MKNNSKDIIDGNICKLCNIKYVNRSGLWKHNQNHHVNNNNHLNNHSSQKLETSQNKAFFHNHNDNPNNHNNFNMETIENNTNKKYYCHKCKKCFNNYQNRWRHEKKCDNEKISEDKIIEENNELKTIIKQQTEIIKEMKEKQSEELNQMKSILNELINKNCKVHPKTLHSVS